MELYSTSSCVKLMVGMWHICALASVSQSCVRSIYPAESVQINPVSQVRNVLNVIILKMNLWNRALLCGVNLVQLMVCGNQIILFPVFKLYKKTCPELGKPQMSLSFSKTAELQET